MNPREFIIAVDGPSGVGKSTLCKALATRLGLAYIDTGALYRAIGLATLRAQLDPTSEASVAVMIGHANLSVEPGTAGKPFTVRLDGDDVTDAIRTPEVSQAASQVSAHPSVRAALLPLQRRLASGKAAILDGRDIGTVVFPHAQLKVFLRADDNVRAERRYRELTAKGAQVTRDAVLAEQRQRDERDTARAAAPLRAADDAVIIDTDALTLEEVITRVEALARSRMWPGVEAQA